MIGSMVHIQCVRCGRKIDTKHERRKVDIPMQLFVAAQKMEKIDVDSFVCTGECQNEYYKWKSLIESLQYMFNEDSSENEKIIPLICNERENF